MNVCRLLSVWHLMIFYSCLVIRVTFGFWILLSHAVCAELTFPNTTNSLRSVSELIVCALNKTPDKSLSLQINKHSHTRKVVVEWKLIWRMRFDVINVRCLHFCVNHFLSSAGCCVLGFSLGFEFTKRRTNARSCCMFNPALKINTLGNNLCLHTLFFPRSQIQRRVQSHHW